MAAPAKKTTPTPKRALSVVQPLSVRGFALAHLKKRRATGATAKEIAALLGGDSRPVSGRLSELHAEGVIAMLDKTRGGSHIYVLTQHVNGRPLRARRPNKHSKERAIAILRTELAKALDSIVDGRGKVDGEAVLREFDAIIV